MRNIGRAPNNASKWQMGFNSAFEELITVKWAQYTRGPQKNKLAGRGLYTHA
jgi:hypothetical protein